ncbi:MAG: Smr/MutS family protein [Crocinitomicaceae bacterium]
MSEPGGGIIQSVGDGFVVVLDDSGFDQKCYLNEIAPVHGEKYLLDAEDIVAINEDESYATLRHQVRKGMLTGKRKPVDVWEIDLHIEEITESHSALSNGEIVMKQMRELRSFFQRAKSKRIRKLVIIHGVGMGVLKKEVRSFLEGQSSIDFYDADFREYGKGATAVEIFYSGE